MYDVRVRRIAPLVILVRGHRQAGVRHAVQEGDEGSAVQGCCKDLGNLVHCMRSDEGACKSTQAWELCAYHLASMHELSAISTSGFANERTCQCSPPACMQLCPSPWQCMRTGAEAIYRDEARRSEAVLHEVVQRGGVVVQRRPLAMHRAGHVPRAAVLTTAPDMRRDDHSAAASQSTVSRVD